MPVPESIRTPAEPDVLEQAVEERTQRRVAMALDEMRDRLLTQAEAAELRALLERERRMRWLATSLRTLLVYIAAVVAGATVGWEALRAAVRRLAE